MEGREFGSRLRELRRHAGMTLREVAARLHVSFTYLSKIESGAMPPPSEKIISQLAEVLNADKDELMILAGKIPPELSQILRDGKTLKQLRAAQARQMARSSRKNGRDQSAIKRLLSFRGYKKLSRIGLPIVMVLAVAASLWFTSPVRALKIEFPSQSSSGTLGSTYSFQIKVSIEDQELLPIQSIDLRIYKEGAPSSYSDEYTGLPLTSTNYASYSGTTSTASIKATADNNTWGYSYGYGYAYWQNQGYTFFQPSGYGYGYGFQGGTGTTSITYYINWTVPSGWPAADDYEVEAKINAEGTTTFTKTSNSFSLEAVTIPSIGGGGGGGAPPGVTYVSDYVTSQGRFTRGITAESEDGKVKITINKDTVGLVEERPLSRIKIKEKSEKPDPPTDARIIGMAYDITPDEATFEPPITITYAYDFSSIPEGVSEKNLVIAWWDEDAEEWIVLEGCIVDPVTHTISAPLSHFTVFTALAYTRPADFTVSELSITPTEVDSGEDVIISILVTNNGDLTGIHNISLTIDNVVVDTKQVTLTGTASEEVTFTTFRDVAGSYTVDVEGRSGTFVVKEAPTVPPSTTPASPVPTTPVEPTDTTPDVQPEPINWWLVGGIIAAAMIIGAAIWWIVRRRWAS